MHSAPPAGPPLRTTARAALMPLTAALACLPAPARAQAPHADLRELVTAYAADLADLDRRYDVPGSPERRARGRTWLERRREEFTQLAATRLRRDARIDLWLLQDDVAHRLLDLERGERRHAEMAPLLPHAPPLVAACEAWRRLEPVDPEAAAALLDAAADALRTARDRLADGDFDGLPPPVAQRAVEALGDLQRTLARWFEFHDGYDPLFSWWARAPWRDHERALDAYRDALQKRLVDGRTDDASLVGDPIGEAALLAELRHERIPYTPAELVGIAEREFAWCDQKLQVQSRALDCGDDWRRALELVKSRHRPPGGQPQLIRELAHEAIAFLRERDLLTIPPLAEECWRMAMLSAAAQRVSPFFLGGETIRVSFPTEAMDHDLKLQSLRSNNEHFCRATVHHELIPGHWLQQYSQARHRPWRRMFSTPFWVEGWALYWEMRLYDLGLARTPEDRVGMLYWRKHRCARIVFSLRFHLGEWTPRQCVDYLIERVGHEPAAAEAEVRRSVGGAYGPLYQAAYMLGGLQLRALHRELVGGGHLGEKEFHDAVLRQNSIPIALLRAALRPEEPPADGLPDWRFAEEQ